MDKNAHGLVESLLDLYPGHGGWCSRLGLFFAFPATPMPIHVGQSLKGAIAAINIVGLLRWVCSIVRARLT